MSTVSPEDLLPQTSDDLQLRRLRDNWNCGCVLCPFGYESSGGYLESFGLQNRLVGGSSGPMLIYFSKKYNETYMRQVEIRIRASLHI